MKRKFRNLLLMSAVSMVMLCSSCAKSYYGIYTGFVDYTPYSDKGFFLTESNSVSFEYTPIGSVVVNVCSGYANVEVVQPDAQHSVKKDRTQIKVEEKWKKADMSDVVGYAVQIAKEKGGNGIINIKSEPEFVVISGKRYISGYVLRGMIIRR